MTKLKLAAQNETTNDKTVRLTEDEFRKLEQTMHAIFGLVRIAQDSSEEKVADVGFALKPIANSFFDVMDRVRRREDG